jgi:hypothetical protein
MDGQKGRGSAWRNCGRGTRERVSFPFPVVLGVEAGKTEPRMPIYDNRNKAESAKIMTLKFNTDTSGGFIRKKRIIPPCPRPGKLKPPDSRFDAYIRIQELLKGSHMEKKGLLLTEDPESQIDGMIAFLKDNGFL